MDEPKRYEEQVGFTPNPAGPLPGPIPAPFLGAFPGPFPIPERLPGPWPPDWWRCFRLGPVSGRYEGEIPLFAPPTVANRLLDLRLDIDPRYANSPVMNRISGDFYLVYRSAPAPGRPSIWWRVYQESWIVDAPIVNWSQCQVEITGTVRFWKGVHPATSIRGRIPWGTFSPAGPAEVTFTEASGSTSTYVCTRKSDCFRDLTLEVDICQSVHAAPTLPSYDTHAHLTRPADLPRRTLTVEEAYREAGVCVSIRPQRTIIDDSGPEFSRWSPAELHDAMELHFSQFAGTWPAWQMWGLCAGTFDNTAVGGIMFDAGAAYGGAGEPPERQGFAVFRGHQWFNDLTVGAPANQAQAWAMRQFLYTWVHEAGHAFNFLHSWNKGRPNALSWMNYPQNVVNFWENFRLRFDDEELLHLRHGDRASVIMGGDPWASGGHLEAPSGAMSQLEGTPPIELLLRSKGYFEFLEPVVIECRLRNLLDDLPVDLDTRLNPAYGSVIVYIRRPDGRIVEYAPILCMLGNPQMQTLQPRQSAVQGEDRYSEDVFLSYGSYGFYFDEPGEYLVRGVYQSGGDVLIHSNVHRVRVGAPPSQEEDRIAQDFFSYEVGMSLYLNGSRSPCLSKGMALLESIAERYNDTLLGAKVATTLAHSVARSFFRLPDRQNPVLTKTHSADPQTALVLTAPALAVYKRERLRSLNIAYHQLVRNRAEYMVTLGQQAEARREVATLRHDLLARGVNEPVLNEIKTYEDSL